MSEQIIAFAKAQQNKYVDDLKQYLAIPSISAQPEHAQDVRDTALWLTNHMRDLGAQAEVIETASHPIVFAQWVSGDPHRPTILIYGHYDVQPADPLELWHSDPFIPTVRDGAIYARGASDNKGQHLAHVKAVETYLKYHGSLPVNVKFLIEGEEEIGTPNLGHWIEQNRDLLQCDAVVVSDSSLLAPDRPTLLYALRGLIYFEVEARCAAHDLHSGSYGGNVQNPAMALAQILAQLKDEHGHIAVPGFYDDVRVLGNQEREEIRRIPITEEDIKTESGATVVFGEPGFSVAERMGARPTLEVNGLWGGYTGAGAKTVLPATAHAKLSCRLVPYQDPQRVYEAVKTYMTSLTPPGTLLKFSILQEGSSGTLIDRNAPQVQAAIRAATATYGHSPVFMMEGGSIPVVNDFQQFLGVPIILLGFGLPDDHIHAPDERLSLSCYEKGIEASIRLISEFAIG